jgi:hypothetical protein
LLKVELRQVVRVVVEGKPPSARVEVKRIEGDDVTPARQKWDEKGFFENLDTENVPATVRDLASRLRDIALRFPNSLKLAWGTGKEGSNGT